MWVPHTSTKIKFFSSKFTQNLRKCLFFLYFSLQNAGFLKHNKKTGLCKPCFLLALSGLDKGITLDLSILALHILDRDESVCDEPFRHDRGLLGSVDSLDVILNVGRRLRLISQESQDSVLENLLGLDLLGSLLGSAVTSLFSLRFVRGNHLFELCDNFLGNLVGNNGFVGFDSGHFRLSFSHTWQWAPVTFALRGYFSLTFYIYYTGVFRTFQIFCSYFLRESGEVARFSRFTFFSFSLTFYIYYSGILFEFQIIFCC